MDPQDPQPSPPAFDGRQPGGKFANGNRFGKGNPQLIRMHELRRAALEATTPEMVRGIIAKLSDAALEGDTAAARLVLEYALGKPVASVELSGPDGEPLGGMDWGKVQIAILSALAPYSEAKVAVALKLRELATDADA